MKGKLLSIAVAAVLLIVSPLTAFAEDYKGGDDWNVTFDGKSMTSSFGNKDVDEKIYEMLQPGDSVELSIDLKNTHAGQTDWYLSNEVLQSLEDSQSVAEGGAYTYLLKYVDHAGTETVLFDSENVGGEDTQGGEGLHQATDSLEEYLYLDRLDANASGEVILKVALDGETQGNAYQNTLALLQMNFAVELVDNTPVVNTVKVPGQPAKPSSSHVLTLPKTGDTAPLMVFAIITLVSGFVCIGAVIFLIIRKKKEEEAQ